MLRRSPLSSYVMMLTLCAGLGACNSGTTTLDPDADLEGTETETESETDTGVDPGENVEPTDTETETATDDETATETATEDATSTEEETSTEEGTGTDEGTDSEEGTDTATDTAAHLDPGNLDTTDTNYLWVLPTATGATADAGCGAFATPCTTIQAAINSLSSSHQAILVGEGTYAEALTITGVKARLYGGVTSGTDAEGATIWLLDPRGHSSTIDLVAAGSGAMINVTERGKLALDGFIINSSGATIVANNSFVHINGTRITAADFTAPSGTSSFAMIDATYDADFKPTRTDTDTSTGTSLSTRRQRSETIVITHSVLSLGTITVGTTLTDAGARLVNVLAVRAGRVSVKIGNSTLNGAAYTGGSSTDTTRSSGIHIKAGAATKLHASIFENTIRIPSASNSSAIKVDGVEKTLISHNKIVSSGSREDVGVFAVTPSGTTAELDMDNNLLVANKEGSIAVAERTNLLLKGVAISLKSNTFYSDTQVLLAKDVVITDAASPVTMVNNLFSNQSRSPGHVVFTATPTHRYNIHHNLFYNTRGRDPIYDTSASAALPSAASNIVGSDPLLDVNHRPQHASPGVNKGFSPGYTMSTSTATSTGTGTGTDTDTESASADRRPTDLAGNRRIAGLRIDIGAYEYIRPVVLSDADDTDGDDVANDEDNCPDVYNQSQADQDYDGEGNLCDDDLDEDGTANVPDTDADGDGLLDSDPTELDANGDGGYDVYEGDDVEGDGISRTRDNCPNWPNADQTDMDRDGIGNGCDCDMDGDGLTNWCLDSVYGTDPDSDGDGVLDSSTSENDWNGNGIDDLSEFFGSVGPWLFYLTSLGVI